ncbi:MAG: hypothetical protein AB1486_22465 [Planctomycetota bacterium]
MKTSACLTSLSRSIAVALLLLPAARSAGAQDDPMAGAVPAVVDVRNDPHLRAACERYEFDTWPKGVARAGLALAALDFDGYRGEPLELEPGGMITRHYNRVTGEGSTLEGAGVLVESTVADTVEAAHRQLLAYLAFVSSPKTLPTTAASGIAAGDHGYVGFSGAGPDRIAWIAFVRGNVAVRLVCLDPRERAYPDLRTMARHIDAAIEKMPALERGSYPPRPAIHRLAATANVCRAGETVGLDVQVIDPLGGEPVLRWEIGGPGQGYVEKNSEGGLALTTTAPGTLRLTLFAAGSNGPQTSRSLTIEVVK